MSFVLLFFTVSASSTRQILSRMVVLRQGKRFFTWSLPWMQAMTMGTPAFWAILNAPLRNGSSPGPVFRVPSG